MNIAINHAALSNTAPVRHVAKNLKPCPPSFKEVFIRGGWREVEAVFGARTAVNKRWIIECGGDELKKKRRAYRASLRKVRPARRHVHEKPEPRQIASAEMLSAIDYLRSPQGGSWPISATGQGDYYFGNTRKTGVEIMERAKRKGWTG